MSGWWQFSCKDFLAQFGFLILGGKFLWYKKFIFGGKDFWIQTNMWNILWLLLCFEKTETSSSATNVFGHNSLWLKIPFQIVVYRFMPCIKIYIWVMHHFHWEFQSFFLNMKNSSFCCYKYCLLGIFSPVLKIYGFVVCLGLLVFFFSAKGLFIRAPYYFWWSIISRLA